MTTPCHADGAPSSGLDSLANPGEANVMARSGTSGRPLAGRAEQRGESGRDGSPCGQEASILQQLRAIIDVLPIGAAMVEGDSLATAALTIANAAFVQIVGAAPAGRKLGRDLPYAYYTADRSALLPPSEWPSALALDRGDTVRQLELSLRRADNGWRTVLSSAMPIRHDGRIAGALVLLQDITDRKRTEEALRRSEERYRGLFKHMSEGFALQEILYDEEGRPRDAHILEINPAIERLTGRKRSELVGHTLKSLSSQVEPYWLEKLAAVATTRKPQLIEAYPLAADHHEVRAYSPAPGLVATLLVDVAGHRRAQAENRFQAALLSQLSDAVVFIDEDGRITYWGPGAERQYGIHAEDAIGMALEQVYEQRWVRVQDQQAAETALAQRGFWTGESIHVLPNGDTLHVESTLTVVRDEKGLDMGRLAVIRDVTERKRIEEALRELQRITAALARALTPDQVAEVAVSHMASALGASAGMVALVDQGGTALRLASSIGLDPQQLTAWREALLAARIPLAAAVRDGRELLYEARAAWESEFPHLSDALQMADIGAQIALPLSAEGRTAGAIGILFRGPRRFRNEDRVLLQAVAGQVGQALERARLYEAERRARAEAQEASAAKDQFVAMISHELRNPLTAIEAGLFVLRHGLTAEPQLVRALEIVHRNVRLQARLVNDLLDLSRLTRGKLQLRRAPVALDEVVRAAVQAYEGEARQASLSLQLEVEPHLWVQGDFDRLQQVVMNLLSNALKFTPAGGSIRIHAAAITSGQGPGAALARLVVEDNGIGIEPALQEKLFTFFEQGNTSAQRRPGLGIGLALVRGIVERHGGRVWAESDGPDKGSRFTVELPKSHGPSPQSAAADSAGGIGRIRVLIVEDNNDTRTLLGDGLRLAGYEVDLAASGEQALELVTRVRPDIMFCDIGLPGIDGYELLRRARELPGMLEVPAFAVTGYGQEEDVRRGREAGFAGHFVKPVDIATLDRRIREWLRTDSAAAASAGPAEPR